MNITRYNFKRAMPLIAHTLRTSDFIAFDFEFTGLQFSQELANHQTDSMSLRYWKHAQSVRKYIPPQMGICGFRYFEEEEEGRLECYPFNFYILPYSFDQLPGLDKHFLASVQSFNFLADNRFDFNKLFYESVGYMSHHDYKDYQRQQKAPQQFPVQHADSPECVIYCNSQYLAIRSWLDGEGREDDPRNTLRLDVSNTRAKLFQSLIRNIPRMFPRDMLDCELVNEENTLEMYVEIKRSSPELRKAQETHRVREQRLFELQRFVHGRKISGDFETTQRAMLEFISKEDKEWVKKHENFEALIKNEFHTIFTDPGRLNKLLELTNPANSAVGGLSEVERELELLDLLSSKVVESVPTATDDALGFTRVVDFVAQLKKPLISHNGLLDLMFLYDKFYRPLPET
jgi:hypothetical protein